MHRFGRSAQQKMKDRWGGGFILATVLALAVAWYLGDWLNTKWGDTGDLTGTGSNTTQSPGNGSMSATQMPQRFQLHLVQVGAFRSEANAKQVIQKLDAKEHLGMLTERGADGLYRVYAGLYTNQATADELKAQLISEGVVPKESRTVSVTVDHNPEAIPVSASLTAKSADLKKGLEMLNTYLFEAALVMESRAATSIADTANLAKVGKELSTLAAMLKSEKDPKVLELAAMASLASTNATAMEAASTASPTADEYQSAMRGYLSLLDQYRSFHSK